MSLSYQCDEGKPACMKCIRTNRLCQGYRNPAAVRFRNLTQQQVKTTGSVRRREFGAGEPEPTHVC